MAHDHSDDRKTRDVMDRLVDSLLTISAAIGAFIVVHDKMSKYKRSTGALAAYLAGSAVHHFVSPDTCVTCKEYQGKFEHIAERQPVPA